jgi:hypothetical protein
MNESVATRVHGGALHFSARAALLLLANGIRSFAGAHLIYIGVVHEQGFERQRLGQQEVANVIAAYGQVVQTNGLAAFHSQLDRLQVRVHRHVHAGDRSIDDGAIFELNDHSLVVEFHEEAN